MIDEKWIKVEEDKCEDAVKLCHYYLACPYGTLAELFPLLHGEHSCHVFGHDYPFFYHVEGIIEFSAMAERELDILPEANNVSDFYSFGLKKYFVCFFKGHSNFIRNNFKNRYSRKDLTVKKFLINGLKRVISRLESQEK